MLTHFQVGHFTFDNAENNATAMRELESLLKSRDPDLRFDHLNNHIRCFPHIINICASHVIQSSMRISEKPIKEHVSLSIKSDNSGDSDRDNNDEDEDEDNDNDDYGDDTTQPLKYDKSEHSTLSVEEWAWVKAMKCNPIKHARQVVRILCSSDQIKLDFKQFIQDGNKGNWFRDSKDAIVEVSRLNGIPFIL